MPDSISRLIALCAVFGVACAPMDAEPTSAFGLPTLHLDVASGDVARLENGTFSKTKVGARVVYQGEQWTADLSIAGRSSVDDAKKSLNLWRNGRKLRLNAMSRDDSALRGALAFEIFAEVGFEVPDPRYVALHINREYIGLYTLHETLDQSFIESRFGEVTSIYAARDRLGGLESSSDLELAFDARPGSYADLRALLETVYAPDRDEIERRIDTLRLSRYMAVTSFIDNSDGIDNNYNLVRARNDLRFKVLPWDLDYSFRTARAPDDMSYFAGNALMNRLAQSPEFRNQFSCALLAVQSRIDLRFIDEWTTQVSLRIKEAHDADPVLGLRPDAIGSAIAQIREFRENQVLAKCPE